MQNPNDEIDSFPEWPDKTQGSRTMAFVVIGTVVILVGVVICNLGYDLGHHYLPMLWGWVTRVLLGH